MVYQSVAFRGSVSQADSHVAVLDTTCCARILLIYAHTLVAFLQETRFIYHERCVPLTQMLDYIVWQAISHCTSVLAGVVQQSLYTVGVLLPRLMCLDS